MFFSKGLEGGVAERRTNSHDRPRLNAAESILGTAKQGRLVGGEHSRCSGGVVRVVAIGNVLLVIWSASWHLTVTLETVTVKRSAIDNVSHQAMWSSGEIGHALLLAR